MVKNNPHSVDRAYKFIYRVFGLKFHQYLYHEGEKIEFLETEIPDTGQRRDIMVKVDDDKIRITEFMVKPLNDEKLTAMHDYHESARRYPEYSSRH